MEFSHTYNWKEYTILKLKSIFRLTFLKIVLLIGVGHILYGISEMTGLTNYNDQLPIQSICFGLSILSIPLVLGLTIKKQFINNVSLNKEISYNINLKTLSLKGTNFSKTFEFENIKSFKIIDNAYWIKMKSNEEVFIPTLSLSNNQKQDLNKFLVKK